MVLESRSAGRSSNIFSQYDFLVPLDVALNVDGQRQTCNVTGHHQDVNG